MFNIFGNNGCCDSGQQHNTLVHHLGYLTLYEKRQLLRSDGRRLRLWLLRQRKAQM